MTLVCSRNLSVVEKVCDVVAFCGCGWERIRDDTGLLVQAAVSLPRHFLKGLFLGFLHAIRKFLKVSELPTQ